MTSILEESLNISVAKKMEEGRTEVRKSGVSFNRAGEMYVL